LIDDVDGDDDDRRLRDEFLRDEYERALASGRGLAVLQANDEAARHREALLASCIHIGEIACDPQMEGARVEYLLDIIAAADELPFYRDQILQALEAATESWDLNQLFEFALRFAQEGDADARSAMYRRFARIDDLPGPHFYAEGFITLDGVAGLLFVLDTLGSVVLRVAEFIDDYWLIDAAQRALGADVVDEALRRARATNPRIAAYLESVERFEPPSRDQTRQYDLTHLTYVELSERLVDPNATHLAMYPLRSWAKSACDVDIRRAADDMPRFAGDAKILSRYVQIFGNRAYPDDPRFLIDIVASALDSPTNFNDRSPEHMLPWFAVNALERVKHPDVRAFAWQLQASPRFRGRTVDLLVENYEVGDYRQIIDILSNFTDEDDVHAALYALDELAESYPEPEVLPRH
jgi:hypothetical protein